ncbi:MAG: zinc-ribbon domain-containing protein [Fibrobacter sp.]|nr:zinc-ribbon domain-containing protein [Fibrobacter sp.]
MKICPHCGAELKDGAKFCPHCGSDETTGWADGAEFVDEELPDYDEIIANEFGLDTKGKKIRKQSPLFIAAAIIVALAFVAGFVL